MKCGAFDCENNQGGYCDGPGRIMAGGVCADYFPKQTDEESEESEDENEWEKNN